MEEIKQKPWLQSVGQDRPEEDFFSPR